MRRYVRLYAQIYCAKGLILIFVPIVQGSVVYEWNDNDAVTLGTLDLADQIDPANFANVPLLGFSFNFSQGPTITLMDIENFDLSGSPMVSAVAGVIVFLKAIQSFGNLGFSQIHAEFNNTSNLPPVYPANCPNRIFLLDRCMMYAATAIRYGGCDAT